MTIFSEYLQSVLDSGRFWLFLTTVQDELISKYSQSEIIEMIKIAVDQELIMIEHDIECSVCMSMSYHTPDEIKYIESIGMYQCIECDSEVEYNSSQRKGRMVIDISKFDTDELQKKTKSLNQILEANLRTFILN